MNKDKLKEGIKNILDEYDKIESMVNNYNRIGDSESANIIYHLKSDMDQTCARYERYINKESYERFYSAFDGNNNSYSFNRNRLFPIENTNNNNNNDNNNNKEKNKYLQELKKFGGFMKKGIYSAGRAVKSGTIKGYNYVKEKVSDENKARDEAWENYMDNIDSKSRNNYQNNQGNNSFNRSNTYSNNIYNYPNNYSNNNYQNNLSNSYYQINNNYNNNSINYYNNRNNY